MLFPYIKCFSGFPQLSGNKSEFYFTHLKNEGNAIYFIKMLFIRFKSKPQIIIQYLNYALFPRFCSVFSSVLHFNYSLMQYHFLELQAHLAGYIHLDVPVGNVKFIMFKPNSFPLYQPKHAVAFLKLKSQGLPKFALKFKPNLNTQSL